MGVTGNSGEFESKVWHESPSCTNELKSSQGLVEQRLFRNIQK